MDFGSFHRHCTHPLVEAMSGVQVVAHHDPERTYAPNSKFVDQRIIERLGDAAPAIAPANCNTQQLKRRQMGVRTVFSGVEQDFEDPPDAIWPEQ